MRTYHRPAFVAVIVGLVAACGAAPRQLVKVGPADVQSLADANNRFGFRLFAELTAAEEGKNVFVSPASIAIALQMTENGAVGETRAEMARTLELVGMTPDVINAAAQSLQQALVGADSKVKMQIANSLWANRLFKFKKPFLDLNRRYFAARATSLDFASPAAPATINGWVKENTNGLIREMVTRLSSLDVLLLINAIYFKGAWTRQFNKEATGGQEFYADASGETSKPIGRVMMMHQSGDYSYYEEPEFQAVRLPYGGGRLAMYVFLPARESNLDAFMAQLTADEWSRMLGQFSKREGDIALPRFKLEYSSSLVKALRALGMELAFSLGLADFSQMGGQPGTVFISNVLHKAFVEVNEEGTEAAAATSVTMTLTAMPRPRDRFTMVVDRPFFCAIQDSGTGSVLFMGAIRDPR